MEKIDFHFDPICPWAWLTSRWASRLEELGELEVRWRFFSLAVAHLEEGDDPAPAADSWGSPALRLLALARRQEGNAGVARLYAAIGTAVHEEGRALLEDGTLAHALDRAGMDPALLSQSQSDRTLWDEVLADHRAAVAACEAFGVPTIVLDQGRGPGAFGPVITRLPEDREAIALLQDTARMLRRDYLFEIKRDREGHPPLVGATGS
ncbi:MAG: DsbA family protein [Candidatus Dormibacteraeota bacterium]|nr:DsbA family protein [Candidatus Dormibacteraeota bacterium]